MRCLLREYRALKRIPLLGARGDIGALRALGLREKDWKIVSVLADFGEPVRLPAARFEYSVAETESPTIRLLEGDGGALSEDDAPVRANEIDADELLGCGIVAAGDDDAGWLIRDLLIHLKDWTVKYFVVGIGDDAVLLHSSWVTAFMPDVSLLVFDGLPVRALASAPVYPGIESLTPGFEDTVYRHYTRREFAADAS